VTTGAFTVVQIGAREHYAVARALLRSQVLQRLLTDVWVPPGSMLNSLPQTRRLRDRYHPDLVDASVLAANKRSLLFELSSRMLRSRVGWSCTMRRNTWFQRWCVSQLRASRPRALFAYSYAAGEIFRQVRSVGCITVLGQIDPGLLEETLVAEEHRRYHQLLSAWRPAPAAYWQAWHQELDLADCIVVNSRWSLSCLQAQGLQHSRLRVIPLVYEPSSSSQPASLQDQPCYTSRPFQLLFLGTIGLRKGIGRLLDTMRLLSHRPVQLTLAGPTELDPQAWADASNVRWIGPVPRSAVTQIYRNADAMILPTLSDGFALTQLEALSYGCPLIVSRHCGEVVQPGRNGWLLDDLEPDSIAAVILEAMQVARELPRPLPLPATSLNSLAEQLQGILQEVHP
jgi:glycosyltransferase involved in cell wall biosynthesis